MAFDLLEDLLAFLYATGDREDASVPTAACPKCGADLEAHAEGGEMRCPDCSDESDML